MKPHLIGGRWETADRAEAVIAPYSGETLGEVPVASASQIDAAVAAADRAGPVVAALPTWRRIEILRATANALAERHDTLAATISAEAAKPIDFARGEVDRAIQTFRFAADELVAVRGDVIPLDAAPKGEGKWGLTRRFPAGPVLAITPFNFPLNLAAHKVAPAMAAGCPIVLKPANKTPLTALLLAEAVLEAGWPPEALSVMNVAVADAGALVRDDRFAVLSFTGSDTVGWRLKGEAGRKRCLLELGGDAAVIVAEDADDLDAIADRVAFGAFAYAGQVCISVQRVLVHRRHHDAFVASLVRATRELVRFGAPDEPGIMMSCLIDDRAAAKVGRIVRETLAAGATCHTAGGMDGKRAAPMVLTNVAEGSPLDVEEVFGPAVHVAPFDGLNEAFAQVNRSRFGLQAGIFTGSLDTTQRAFESLAVGGVMVNDVPTFRVDHMPYGGIKDSGLGREGLRHAYDEFTEPRLLVLPMGVTGH